MDTSTEFLGEISNFLQQKRA